MLTVTLMLLLPQELLVSGYNSDTVHRFDLMSFAEGVSFSAVPGAQSLRYGPDGALYVVSEKNAQVLRFDGQTGAFIDVFVSDDPLTPEDESGGLTAPTAAVFGPDGHLYVGDFADNDVLRYDGQTGAFIDTFIPSGTFNTNGVDAGMAFGPDGDLYVPGFYSNRVTRFDGQSGAFEEVVVGLGDGLLRPRALRFREDGTLYVASWGNGRILRKPWNGAVETFATTFRPTGFEFDPGSGDLLVTNDQDNAVRRLDGDSGAPLGMEVLASGSPIDGGTWVAIIPDPRLRLSRLDPGASGALNRLKVSNATADGLVILGVGFAPDSLQIGGCPNAWLGVAQPGLSFYLADAASQLTVEAFVGPELAGLELWLQAFDVWSCRSSATVVQALQ